MGGGVQILIFSVFFKVNVQNGNSFGVCLNFKYFLCDNFWGNQHILGLSLRSKKKNLSTHPLPLAGLGCCPF